MKIWRSSKRRTASPQPSLPGLFTPQPKNTVRRLATPGEYALDRAQQRLVFTLCMFAIAFMVIAGRLADLTLLSNAPDSPTIQATNGENPITTRADIVDRNGTVLATSLPTISLCADGRKLINIDEAVAKLHTVLPDIDSQKLSNALDSKDNCVPIKRHLTPKQYYEVNKIGIAGLEFHPDERRLYPAGNTTAHVVGYADIDDHGLAGMEKSQDARLQRNPEPLQLSLDLRLQTILRRELSSAYDEFHAVGAAGIIMDVTTGEILSMVSLPDFDPHHPGTASDDAKFNRDTLGVYEMGSTFKIFNTAMALDSGIIHPADRFDTLHPIEVGHKFIHDFHPSNHNLNVAEIFMESSNIGSAHMAEKVGGVQQRAFLARLGLASKTSLELPEIGAPLLPPASNWGDSTTMTVAFGQGIAVNAVQLASAVASIINEGRRVQPTLIKKDSTQLNEKPNERVVSPQTTAMMRALMRLVVTDGTAKAAEVAGYMVGGKTGTADKLDGHKYAKNARRSSFIGVFPINAPRYLVFALLDDPKGNAKTYGFATGGWTAAPVVGKVITQIGPLLDMPPSQPELTATNEQKLVHALGPEVLSSLQMSDKAEDYAAVESDSAN